MIKEYEKVDIADLANGGLNGREIALALYGEKVTSTQLRNVTDFLNTYECDQLRNKEANYDNLEDWHLKAIQCQFYGMSIEQIAETILGSVSKTNTVRRFFKTSLAHELSVEFIKNKNDSVDETFDDEDEGEPISAIDGIFKRNKELKILFWDMETSPCVSYHYQHWKVNIRQDQAIKQTHLLSISYAFNDEEPVGFKLTPSDVCHEDDLTLVVNMIEAIEQADIIVGYNSINFDMKILRTRALYWDLPPIKPVKHVDLYQQVKRNFKFPSNALGNVSSYLQLEGKLITDKGLWRRCMEHWNRDECELALEDMLTYNLQDITATRDLYYRLRGWLTHSVNVGNMTNHVNETTDKETAPKRCTKCGSDNVLKMTGKFSYANVKKYQLYRCENCGAISRESPNGLAGCPANS